MLVDMAADPSQPIATQTPCSATQISAYPHSNVHRTTVTSHLEQHHVSRRGKRKLNDQQVSEAAKLYRAGNSLAKLGTCSDIDPQTISRELKKAGATLRPPGRQGNSSGRRSAFIRPC